MRSLIALILLLTSFSSAAQQKGVFADSAQQHHLFAELSLPPCLSVAYNYKLTKHLSAGLGMQAYMFPPTADDTRRFLTSIYSNIRLNIMTVKKNQLFTFFDLGMNFYKQDISYKRDSTIIGHYPHNNGFYFGWGFGYFRLMTKHGGGPYISLKIQSNWYMLRGYSVVAEEQEIGLINVIARPAVAIGFKF